MNQQSAVRHVASLWHIILNPAKHNGFDPRSGKSKAYKIDLCCFSANKKASRTCRLGLRIMWPSGGETCLPLHTAPAVIYYYAKSVLDQYKTEIMMISSINYLICQWGGWKLRHWREATIFKLLSLFANGRISLMKLIDFYLDQCLKSSHQLFSAFILMGYTYNMLFTWNL